MRPLGRNFVRAGRPLGRRLGAFAWALWLLASCDVGHAPVEPARGSMQGGGRVRIHGEGFVGRGAPAVYFGDAHALAVVVYSDRVIGALPPESSEPGPVTVRVVFEDGEELRYPDAFTFDARGPTLDLRPAPGG